MCYYKNDDDHLGTSWANVWSLPLVRICDGSPLIWMLPMHFMLFIQQLLCASHWEAAEDAVMSHTDRAPVPGHFKSQGALCKCPQVAGAPHLSSGKASSSFL